MNRFAVRRPGSSGGVLPLLAQLLLLATLTAGCGEAAPEQEGRAAAPEPIVAAVQTALVEELPRTLSATGSLEAWRRVSPGSKIMGRIDRVAVNEGDRVRAGQLLAQLDRRDLDAAIAQAAAGVEMAGAALENAGAQHRRMTALQARGSATDKNLEDATAGLRMAQAGVAQAEANLNAARVMLDYAEVRSPLDGWVVARQAEAGDMARPGIPLLVLEDLARVKVAVQVPESEVSQLRPGMPAAVVVDAIDGRFEAPIDSIVPGGDPGSGGFEVRLRLDNPGGRLRSGMYVRMEVVVGTRQALMAPATALVRRGQLEGIWVLDASDQARLRLVKTGRGEGELVEILSGLEPADRFLPRPPAGIAAGVRVVEG